MSAIDFVVEGPSGDSFAAFDFFNADEAEVALMESGPNYVASQVEVTKTLNERVIEIIQGDKSLFIIDNVVKVLAVSNQIRQERVEFWESRRFEMYCLGAAGAVGAIGSAGLMAFGVPLAFSLASLVTSVVTLGFGFKRASDASTQVSHWSFDLPAAIAAQRKKVFEEGFLIALRNGYPQPYSVVLNQSELLGLHYDYFCQFIQSLREAITNQDRVRLIEAAIQQGPLNPEVLKVAQFSQDHFRYLSAYLNEYNRIAGEVQRIISAAREQQAAMCREIEGRIALIEGEKRDALKPLEELFAQQKKQLEEQRREALRNLPPGGDNTELCRAIEADYQKALEELKKNYEREKEIISRPFDERIKRERDLLALYTKNIDRYKIEQLLPYFTPLAQVQIDTLAEYQRLFCY